MDLEEGRMEKGMILYQSKYGAARKYAGWLREETGFEIREVKNCKIEEVLCFERLILCSGIYASGIAGISFFQKNIEKLQGKQLFVFTVGASPYHENALKELKRKNMKGRLCAIPLFYGRGMWLEEKMTWKDRTLCRMLKKAVAKKAPDTWEPWMAALMSTNGQNCDWTDRKYLKPLLDALGNRAGLEKQLDSF